MSNVPEELKYTKSHEWIRSEGDDSITVGITEHAQDLLGDMVFVELPENGRALTAEEDCAVVESVKAASDVYAPMSGEVVEVNEDLEDEPELINEDAFGAGWMIKIEPTSPEEWDELLDADAYKKVIEEG